MDRSEVPVLFRCVTPTWLAVVFLVMMNTADAMHISTDSREQFSHRQFPGYSGQFALAKHFQSHMVLQQAPQRANIYGFSPDIGADVMLKMKAPRKMLHYSTTVIKGPEPGVGVWSITLDPMKMNDSVTITVESSGNSTTLEDVLFGDVWICSGQSNMQFMVMQIFGGAEEIANASKYPNIRFANVHRQDSSMPLFDLIALDQDWTAPTNETVAHFSAVCWLYGKALYKALGYPIGLVGSDYGGTPIEAWSSPQALAKCGVNGTKQRSNDWRSKLSADDKVLVGGPNDNSALWNSMINPLLGMTIYGAIWYQGEGDSVDPVMMNNYNCTFPTMIDDWRHRFHYASNSETSSLFPFGFVQLSASEPPENPGFVDIRWHQTADVGFVPNKRMPQVFMAVAMDLPDFDSNSGPVHTRHKKPVGYRLSLAGLAVAYKRKEMFQGPFPVMASVVSEDSMEIDYGGEWTLDVRNTEGFELLCTSGYNSTITWWLPTSITFITSTTVTIFLPICGEGQNILGLRYAWQTTPCALETCAVYSTINQLPAPPFIAYTKNFVNGKPVFEFRK